MHLDDLPDVLTVRQAARFFNVNAKTMYDAIRLGRIPAYRFGKAIRLSRQKLAQLLERGEFEQIETKIEEGVSDEKH